MSKNKKSFANCQLCGKKLASKEALVDHYLNDHQDRILNVFRYMDTTGDAFTDSVIKSLYARIDQANKYIESMRDTDSKNKNVYDNLLNKYNKLLKEYHKQNKRLVVANEAISAVYNVVNMVSNYNSVISDLSEDVQDHDNS